MSYRLQLQTDLREEHLDPSETKKGSKGILGTVSTDHHGITRSGDLVRFPDHDALDDSTLDLASGTLITTTGRDPHHALYDLVGRGSHLPVSVNYRTDRVWAPQLFELERMMTRPLNQLDLLGVSDPYLEEPVPSDYILVVRMHLVEFLERYRESVTQSKLQKPVIERHFQVAQRMDRPENLQRLYGGQLYRTLQEVYDPKKQRAGKKK